MEFCKQYNAATESQRGDIVPVEISVFEDRSFTFITKTPPAARLILKAAGVDKGSPTPHTKKVATISQAQVREIATTKMADLNANDIDAAPRSSPAPPARWASPSPASAGAAHLHPRTTPVGGARTVRAPSSPRLLSAAEERHIMAKRSKAYRAAAEKVDLEHLYTPLEAVRLAKQTSVTKYDATVEVAMRLGVDPRKADQMVRGT
jgi:hypothetical protein